ncbi:MAG: FAD-dependent oxidoreductase [Spirochaetales bacterium]|nr:FAD-dependent oxidoreductase [Spirochaetales bacterium]
MRNRYDVAVIGAGAAGLAASATLAREALSVLTVDREESAGGILPQCIHDGFGLHRYGQALTGPEFSARLEGEALLPANDLRLGTTVLSLFRDGESWILRLSSVHTGVYEISARAVVLAMGSRERNRGNVRIAGDRPSGVFTAGLAQRLMNIDGFLPGKEAVIIGSGDIGLIMARRLTLSGVHVQAVVEIQGYPSGLARNVVQCLEDFSIPLYLSHATIAIRGRQRVTACEVAPIEHGAPVLQKAFQIPCDTVLLSVGLVPETELATSMGVALDPVTGGPRVDSRYMTNLAGVFACGNVLQIHDLVDHVAAEAENAARSCVAYVRGEYVQNVPFVSLECAQHVRSVVPSCLIPGSPGILSLRSLSVLTSARLRLRDTQGTIVFEKKLGFIRPAEMIVCAIPDAAMIRCTEAQRLIVSLEDDEQGGAPS